ncbi:Cap-specific mRNA (nucleoside-2'-O-)-methyltransferase 2 [Oopsacas minuta]|uniref:Cap-specific mRNA (nucleoside-2'-O-)-methyltransferase 2 n=1 Tax=Oopsacas minuta TaxID=111878 RepID=A0AAV7K2P6_9METZ|nr:Cap-specific mRNA (nucleoside-2'-O-)-methyltransferase 2 [Oopsacas minuta]
MYLMSHRGRGDSPYQRGRGRYPRRPGIGAGYRGHGPPRNPKREREFEKRVFSEEVQQEVDNLFNKKFSFDPNPKDNPRYLLPSADLLFSGEHFTLEKLASLKLELNIVKDKLNDKDPELWHDHTRRTNKAGLIVKNIRRQYHVEMCTQAWAKFHEILCMFPSICNTNTDDAFYSVHLCEAPGGFIGSLNHYIRARTSTKPWKWRGLTLNPYNESNDLGEMVDDDRFILETIEKWSFGLDNTGNVMRWKNILSLERQVKEETTRVDLVSADGSRDCQDNPNQQELRVSQLHYCESMAAMRLLSPGGSFILKLFTLFESQTLCLLYLLACSFGQLHLFKPSTSKAGNSEVYLVCLKFHGIDTFSEWHLQKLESAYTLQDHDKSIFPLSSLSSDFITSAKQAAEIFSGYQRDQIESNLRLFTVFTKPQQQFLSDVQLFAVESYDKRCSMKYIQDSLRILPDLFLDGIKLSVMALLRPDSKCSRQKNQDSLNDRRKQKLMSWHELHEIPTTSDESISNTIKRPRLEESGDYSEVSKSLLRSMGHQEGEGLGPSGEGRSEPVIPQTQQWGMGLGYEQGTISSEDTEEDIRWLKMGDSKSEMRSLFGDALHSVLNSRFCYCDTLQEMTEARSSAKVLLFTNREPMIHRCARDYPFYAFHLLSPPHSIPVEGLALGEIDTLLNFSSKISQSVIESKEVVHFLDLSHDPSGFSDYLCWKLPSAQGYGIRRTEMSGAVSSGRDTTRTVSLLLEQPVDLLLDEDLEQIYKECLSHSQVDLVIGDCACEPGSLMVYLRGHEEKRARQYFLVQIIIALHCLKKGGVFICRIYDIMTRATAGLIYFLHTVFSDICIVKPALSEPLSSERYLFCKGLQDVNRCKLFLLQELNKDINKTKESDPSKDILEIYPVHRLFQKEFFQFITLSNERLSKNRLEAIKQIERLFYLEGGRETFRPSDLTAVCKIALERAQIPLIL